MGAPFPYQATNRDLSLQGGTDNLLSAGLFSDHADIFITHFDAGYDGASVSFPGVC